MYNILEVLHNFEKYFPYKHGLGKFNTYVPLCQQLVKHNY